MLNKRNKMLLFILVSLITLGINQGGTSNPVSTPKIETTNKVQAKELDPRAKILSEYFASKGSPFQYQAQNFVDAADKNGLDWKLVPAISGVESTFGKATYGYNAWGWGIYGDNRLGFASWKDGIDTVSGGLKTGYIDKGLTDPYAINKVYAASPTWGARVTFFMNDINAFADTHGSTTTVNAAAPNPLTKTAGASAQLALK